MRLTGAATPAERERERKGEREREIAARLSAASAVWLRREYSIGRLWTARSRRSEEDGRSAKQSATEQSTHAEPAFCRLPSCRVRCEKPLASCYASSVPEPVSSEQRSRQGADHRPRRHRYSPAASTSRAIEIDREKESAARRRERTKELEQHRLAEVCPSQCFPPIFPIMCVRVCVVSRK